MCDWFVTMMISFELAKRKLADIFGDDETRVFLEEASSKPDLSEELIGVVLTMYDAYGPEETHEIFEALDLKVPHLEESLHNKGAKQLAQFRTKQWTYPFSENSPFGLIQMGINHMVLYPAQTELGQLDRGSHTSIDYHWDFPGLIAMQSILHFVSRFIHEEDYKKTPFNQEIINCVKGYSQHVADTLLQLLPEVVYELDKPILHKVSKLVAILTAIKEKGLYDAGIESMDLVSLSPSDYKELSSLMEVKGNDVMSMLRVFLLDLQTYKNNVSKLGVVVDLASSTEKLTASRLATLASCLDDGASHLEALSQHDLTEKLATLENATDPEDKKTYELVMQELKMRELQRVAGIDQWVDDSKDHIKQILHGRHVEKADEVTQDKKEPSLRDRIAAALFLTRAITVYPEDEYFDPASYYDISPKYWPNINAAVVHRMSGDDRPLMTTPNVLAVFKPGATINFYDILSQLGRDLPHQIAAVQSIPDSIEFDMAIVKATWFDMKTKPASSGADANVFGHLGTLEVAEELKSLQLPVHHAGLVSSAFLKHFGASLVPLDKDIPYKDTPPVDLICAEYDFKNDYIPEYVMKIQKGGGVFVETHGFRQFFTPLEPSTSGGIILGKKRENGDFEFAAFEIPFGYSLVIDPHVIHGDSFFKGRYAIALTEVVSADSVLIRTPTGAILPVSQRPVVSPVKDMLPSLKETQPIERQEKSAHSHQFFSPEKLAQELIIQEVEPVKKMDP